MINVCGRTERERYCKKRQIGREKGGGKRGGGAKEREKKIPR